MEKFSLGNTGSMSEFETERIPKSFLNIKVDLVLEATVCIGEVVMEILDKNDNGHPTNEEAKILNDLEDQITSYLKQTQTLHSIGRVTRNGERDIIFYMDKPKLDGNTAKEFFDSINAIRPINMKLKKDKKFTKEL